MSAMEKAVRNEEHGGNRRDIAVVERVNLKEGRRKKETGRENNGL